MSFTQRVKRLFTDEHSSRPYQCQNCGRSFDLNRQSCPNCGSYRIERSRYDDLLDLEGD